MNQFEKDEFWKALGRLYDSTLALRETVEELTRNVQQDGEHIRALVRIAEMHERRISRLEGTDQA
jgi:hypothetical protein